LGALSDQTALEFRQRSKHVKNEPPLCGRRIEGLGQAASSSMTRSGGRVAWRLNRPGPAKAPRGKIPRWPEKWQMRKKRPGRCSESLGPSLDLEIIAQGEADEKHEGD
jgi:hypothetical protein